MRGKVLYWRQHLDKPTGVGFGFIAPDDGGGRREENYWFGPKALRSINGRIPRAGDIVEFDQGDFNPGRGPKAARITAILDNEDREEITTLAGELET